MKKVRIFFIWSLLLAAYQGNAQTYCWETTNTVTTDWRDYPGAGGTDESNNDFDWTAETYNKFYLRKNYDPATQNTPTQTLTLPMWAPTSSTGTNSNLFDFQSISSAAEKDFHPEDGWELLVKYFGECCDEDKAVENPFYAIYNRKTGKVRVFLMVTEKSSNLNKTGAMVHFTWEGTNIRKTALFQHLEPASETPLTFTTTNDFNAPNRYVNNDLYWLYAEFTVAYDPCTCTDTRESKITFQFSLLSTMEIDANITGELVEKVDPVNPAPTVATQKNGNWAVSLYNDVTRIDEAGQKGYKKFAEYETEALKYLNKFTNEKYRDMYWRSFDTFNKKSQKLGWPSDFKNDPLLGGRNAMFRSAGGGPISKTDFLNGQTALYNSGTILLGQEKVPFLDRNYGLIKNAASYIPYLGYAYGAYQLLTSGGAEETSQAIPTPQTYVSNLEISGKIEVVAGVGDNIYFTPGSKTSGNFVPTYNNILGVFNVMEMPNVEYVSYDPHFVDATGQTIPVTAHDVPKIRQYRLTTPIQYVVNPAANLEVVSVDACYVMEYDSRFLFRNHAVKSYWNVHDQYPVSFTGSQRTPPTGFEFVDSIMKSGLHLENLPEKYLPGDLNNTAKIAFRTAYVPLECFHNQTFDLFNWEHRSGLQAWHNRMPDLSVKMVIVLKDKLNPNNQPTMLIFTYKLDNQNIGQFDNQPQLSYNVWIEPLGPNSSQVKGLMGYRSLPFFASPLNAPETLVIKTGQSISNKTVYAKNKIIVESGANIGNNTKLIAGGSIEVKSSNVLNPNVELLIKKGIGDCFPDLQNNVLPNSEILTHCQSNKYLERAISEPIRRDNPKLDKSKDELAFAMKPNPSREKVFIKIASTVNDDYSATLRDIQGRTISQIQFEVTDGVGNTQFNTSVLSNGVYFVTITNGGDRLSKKLIVSH